MKYMDKLKQRSLEQYSSKFEIEQLKELYESVDIFVKVAFEKVTPDLVLDMPEVSPNQSDNTRHASVVARYQALKQFGIDFGVPEIPLKTKWVLDTTGNKGDSIRYVATGIIPAEWRARIISTYAVYSLIKDILGITNGLDVDRVPDENNHLVKKLEPNREWNKEGLAHPELLPAVIDQFTRRLIEYRIDNAEYYKKIPGQSYSFETNSRNTGSTPNADGKVSMEELTKIIRMVTAALSQK